MEAPDNLHYKENQKQEARRELWCFLDSDIYVIHINIYWTYVMEHTKVDAFLQLQPPFIWNKPDLVWKEITESVFCWMLPLGGERWLFSVNEPLQVSIS